MTMETRLLEKIGSKKAVVGVIGLGYVGLPLLISFLKAGFQTVGFDIDEEKVRKLKAGLSYFRHIPADPLKEALRKGRVLFTHRPEALRQADAVIICVPTPLNLSREPDLSFITNTMDALLPHIRKGQLISLESTTYPGTTEEEIIPRLGSRGLRAGKDCFVVFSPEREDPGNKVYQTTNIPKVLGGSTAACGRVGKALYGQVVPEVVQVSSLKTAEMTKLLENIHRAVNIGLVNELKIVCDAMGIDIHEVIAAASTKPFGFTPYRPGPGLGGHCIPIDPFYLTWKARQYGVSTRFIELAGEINSGMPDWVVDKAAEALNARQKSVRGSRVLVLGLAYKKNVEDIRESPSLEIIEKLMKRGAVVAYNDPYVKATHKMRHHDLRMRSVALTRASLRSFDCVLIATDHDAYDFEFIRAHSRLVVDSRGVYPRAHPNVVKA